MATVLEALEAAVTSLGGVPRSDRAGLEAMSATSLPAPSSVRLRELGATNDHVA